MRPIAVGVAVLGLMTAAPRVADAQTWTEHQFESCVLRSYLGILRQSAAALHNYRIPLVNEVRNWWDDNIDGGSSRAGVLAGYKVAEWAIIAEAGAHYDLDRKSLERALDPRNSPGQLNSSIDWLTTETEDCPRQPQ